MNETMDFKKGDKLKLKNITFVFDSNNNDGKSFDAEQLDDQGNIIDTWCLYYRDVYKSTGEKEYISPTRMTWLICNNLKSNDLDDINIVYSISSNSFGFVDSDNFYHKHIYLTEGGNLHLEYSLPLYLVEELINFYKQDRKDLFI